MGKKQTEREMIEVLRYDEEMGDSYTVQVPKVPLTACQLCACAGCLSDKCCEHLEYWKNEHGKPARYQVDDLVEDIKRRDKVIKALEERLEAISQSCSVYLKREHVGVIPEDKAFVEMIRAAAKDDPARMDRIFVDNDYLCSACQCLKCCERMQVVLRNRHKFGEFAKVPECCGHKVSTYTDLPF